MRQLKVKRVYEKPEDTDGYRVLVDRLWPRGVRKESALIDEWCVKITPSPKLRTWFHESKESRFDTFKKRYRQELTTQRDAITRLLEKHDTLTLVTAV